MFLDVYIHSVSALAILTAIAVFSVNDVTLMLSMQDEFTASPAMWLVICLYNFGRTSNDLRKQSTH